MSSDYCPRLVADQSLPYLAGLLDAVADVTYLPSQEISRERLIEEKTEGLLVRSVTHCNQSLLEGTMIRSIATATAGFDHIDRDYCSSHSILWRNSPGCNARSVAHWVMGVLAERALHLKRPLAQETLAIIGVGHVGSNVQQMAEALGVKTLLVDPPRAEQEGQQGFSSLEAERATPHIAGFSADGKARGTRMAVETTLEHFGLNPALIPFDQISLPTPENTTINLSSIGSLRPEWVLAHTMKALSQIEQALRQTPDQFESLRVHYNYPREAPAYQLLGVLPEEEQLFRILGYSIA